MDKFRKEYRQLSDEEKELCSKIKDTASELDRLLQLDTVYHLTMPVEDHKERARMRALARTKLEESVMWAIKAITG